MQFVGIIGVVGIFVGGSASYTYSTKFDRVITVKDKYITNYDNRANLMIVDNENNIFRVSRSLWLLKFDNAETWNKLEKDKSYNITGYGIRIPFLRMYPHIVNTKSIDNLPNNIPSTRENEVKKKN